MGIPSQPSSTSAPWAMAERDRYPLGVPTELQASHTTTCSASISRLSASVSHRAAGSLRREWRRGGDLQRLGACLELAGHEGGTGFQLLHQGQVRLGAPDLGGRCTRLQSTTKLLATSSSHICHLDVYFCFRSCPQVCKIDLLMFH